MKDCRFFVLFVLCCVLLLGSMPDGQARQKKLVVCIDPGHGGKDPGKLATTPGRKDEKELTLAISKKLGHYLQTLLKNVTVIYTRTGDEFVSLDERVEIANSKGAHYFISIHCNSHPSSRMYGTQTHIHSHDFKASRALALRIEKEFSTRGGRRSNGIRSAHDRGQNLFVVQYTEMPSVLVEVGYLSNKKEEEYLNWETGQDYIASSIFRAFRDFLGENHPEGNRSTVYKVQLAASATPVSFNTAKFDELGLQVVEHSAKGTFKYKYMVGREYDMVGAQKLLKEVKGAGFKDAFIVKMTGQEAKNFRKVPKS